MAGEVNNINTTAQRVFAHVAGTRGNVPGAQFHAVASRVYELAKAQGLGREIPTEWFLQDERN